MMTREQERELSKTMTARARELDVVLATAQRGEIPNGWDIASWTIAEVCAATLTAKLAKIHLPCDLGGWVSPRYRVILAPMVGDPISYEFNGDAYPCGYIKSISDSYRLITSDKGERFYRRKLSGSWLKQGGTWSLVMGHISKYNREF